MKPKLSLITAFTILLISKNSFASSEFTLPNDLKLEMITDSKSKIYKKHDGEQWVIKVDKVSSYNKIELEKIILNMVIDKKSEFKKHVDIRKIKTPSELLSEFKHFQSVDQGSLFIMGIESKDGVTGKLSTHIKCDAYWNSGVHILVMINCLDSNHKMFYDHIDKLSKLTLNSFPELISEQQ